MRHPLTVIAGDQGHEPKSSPEPKPWQPEQVLTGQRIDAVYIHIPFCFHKCHYCDFYSLPPTPPLPPLTSSPARFAPIAPDSDPRQDAFIERLIAELRLRGQQVELKPETIFIGGGTPTRLTIDQWERLLSAMHQLGLMDRVVEFTVEANPETVTLQAIRHLANQGVDRISIGAQSFQPLLLNRLERRHQPASVAQAIDLARQGGIAHINLDLILAIPGQNMAMLDDDLDQALALAPDHVSYYGLTYEPQTPLAQQLADGRLARIDEDLERAMYQRVIARLSDAGFEHYEISNWARRNKSVDRRCRHNLNYWHNRHWLGLGPSAASHVQGHRWKNLPSLQRYLESTGQPPTCDHEHLPPEGQIGEAIMLRLRLRQGINRNWLRENLLPTDERWNAIDELIQLNLLVWADETSDSFLRLTDAGLMVADPVIARLLPPPPTSALNQAR